MACSHNGIVRSSKNEESEREVTQSCPTLCDPWTVAHQAPPSMGFSRQEYWSGLSFPSPKKKKKKLPVYMITRFNHTNITLSKEAKLLCDEQLLDWQVVIEQKDAD